MCCAFFSAFYLLLLLLLLPMRSYSLSCYCTSDTCINNTCLIADDINTVQYCNMGVYNESSEIRIIAGCQTSGIPPCINGDNTQFILAGVVHCCRTGNFCNRCPPSEACTRFGNFIVPNGCPSCPNDTTPSMPSVTPITSSPSSSSSPSSPSTIQLSISISTGIFLFIITLIIIILVCLFCYCKVSSSRRRKGNEEGAEEISSSGISSGFNGPRLLRTRTISHDIQKIRVIGQGRFGQVWLCKKDDRLMAMKIFKNFHTPSFEREVEIYDTYMLNHDNILRFYCSDYIELPDSIERRTLFQYHENGTLQEFLKNKEVMTFGECHLMSISLANGLQYLHSMVIAGKTKPGIAHRDLKSTNILVKDDCSLCIADLGMAVKQEGESVDELPKTKLSGTKRYMSPEILTERMDYTKFRSYVQSDIYSLSLILWEIYTCSSQPYSLPYQGFVSTDPNVDQMRQCVCISEHRPVIPLSWTDSENLSTIRNTLEESWNSCSLARPTALNILKKLRKIDSKLN